MNSNEMCGCGTEEKTSSAKGLVRINYKEDFELVVVLLAGDKPYKLGDEDFRIDFIVMASRYTVGRTAGVCERCSVDGNKIRCFMDGHGLPPGELRAEVKVNTPDPNYADGKRLNVAIAEGVVVLVKDNTRFDGAVIKANIPVALVDAYQLAKAHGYKGTIDEYYATFTEVGHLKENIKGTLDEMTKAEKLRTDAETERAKAETVRNNTENVRNNTENVRKSSETQRQTNEDARQQTENERVSAESNRESAEVERANAEQQRSSMEEARKNAESQRAKDELARVGSESERAKAETQRQTAEEERKRAEDERQKNRERFNAAEDARVAAEKQRNSTEQTRNKDEQQRQTNEDARQTAETERATAERKRQTDMQEAIERVNERAKTLRDGNDGKSAYDIWKLQGNSGTEADFISSLGNAMKIVTHEETETAVTLRPFEEHRWKGNPKTLDITMEKPQQGELAAEYRMCVQVGAEKMQNVAFPANCHFVLTPLFGPNTYYEISMVYDNETDMYHAVFAEYNAKG
ncbi:hypothetical protein [Hoylesella timonensis]|uniref:hypothetical protein n=1 Tax=Hoylesella timonensis TaxID=386414 RepID=UPI00189863A3|nr:hypothetical protein [Hoylesella timonensis]